MHHYKSFKWRESDGLCFDPRSHMYFPYTCSVIASQSEISLERRRLFATAARQFSHFFFFFFFHKVAQ